MELHMCKTQQLQDLHPEAASRLSETDLRSPYKALSMWCCGSHVTQLLYHDAQARGGMPGHHAIVVKHHDRHRRSTST